MSLWDNNETQFARLLCELMATQTMDLSETAASMDLEMDELHELLDRANEVWEAAKARLPRKDGKKYYRTVFRYEVLSEDKDCLDGLSLRQIWHATFEGPCSGSFLETHEEEVDGPTMARLLESQGSDPSYFRICSDCGGEIDLGDDEMCVRCQDKLDESLRFQS